MSLCRYNFWKTINCWNELAYIPGKYPGKCFWATKQNYINKAYFKKICKTTHAV